MIHLNITMNSVSQMCFFYLDCTNIKLPIFTAIEPRKIRFRPDQKGNREEKRNKEEEKASQKKNKRERGKKKNSKDGGDR